MSDNYELARSDTKLDGVTGHMEITVRIIDHKNEVVRATVFLLDAGDLEIQHQGFKPHVANLRRE